MQKVICKKTGIFIKDIKDISKAKEFIKLKLKERNEEIKTIKAMLGGYLRDAITIIETLDGWCYEIILLNKDISRGYRWHEVFILDDFDEQLLFTRVYSKIIRHGNWEFCECVTKIDLSEL